MNENKRCHIHPTILDIELVVGISSIEIIDVEEMVAMFLHVLAHDMKNRIKVNVLQNNRPRCRTHKGKIVTNVLGVCDTKSDFIFVLAGWEGLVVDSCILRDALARPNRLQVPKGYPNAERFLVPYRRQRYHLKEWCSTRNVPSTAKEYFNMKHSSIRNVIERVFGLLKGRLVIFHGKSNCPVQFQCCTILACCLLHNLINREMTNVDDLDDIDKGDSTYTMTTASDDIHYIEMSNEWT
ncbi:putative nuclease HARBI1 [Cucumis melo var. makuwa]|uniref:Nuclease HARBI1 n=1 Tax=Cucumis melo var. makuwa TaxID=1194695 RepID=A0A5A7SZZ0_CUCMM|nr:putative nuclease HARBI1 [Cucumis melo var. makuwa]